MHEAISFDQGMIGITEERDAFRQPAYEPIPEIPDNGEAMEREIPAVAIVFEITEPIREHIYYQI